jgi:hypothetical protein
MKELYDRPMHTVEIGDGPTPEAYEIKDKLYELVGYNSSIPWKLLLTIADMILGNLLESHLYAEEAEELQQSPENPAFRNGDLRKIMDRLRRDDYKLREVMGADAEDLLANMEMTIVENNASSYCTEAVKLVEDEDYETALSVASDVVTFYEETIGLGHDRKMDKVFLSLRSAVEGDDIEMMDDDFDEPAMDLDRGPARAISADELNARTRDALPAYDRAADKRNLDVLDSLGLSLGGGDLLSDERRDELKKMYLEEDAEGNRVHTFSEFMGVAQNEMAENGGGIAGGNKPDHGVRRGKLKKWGDNPNAARERQERSLDVEED